MARHRMSLHCAAAALCRQRDCDGALLLRQRVSPRRAVSACTMAGPLRETDGRPPRVPRSGTRLLPRSTCSTCSRAAARTVLTAAVLMSCATGAERLQAALLLGHQPAEHFGPSNSRLIILSITVSYHREPEMASSQSRDGMIAGRHRSTPASQSPAYVLRAHSGLRRFQLRWSLSLSFPDRTLLPSPPPAAAAAAAVHMYGPVAEELGMCGWVLYTREASVWEACCWYSGVLT